MMFVGGVRTKPRRCVVKVWRYGWWDRGTRDVTAGCGWQVKHSF